MRALSTIPIGGRRDSCPLDRAGEGRQRVTSRSTSPRRPSRGSPPRLCSYWASARRRRGRSCSAPASWRGGCGSSGPGSTAIASCSAGCGSAPARRRPGALTTARLSKPCVSSKRPRGRNTRRSHEDSQHDPNQEGATGAVQDAQVGSATSRPEVPQIGGSFWRFPTSWVCALERTIWSICNPPRRGQQSSPGPCNPPWPGSRACG